MLRYNLTRKNKAIEQPVFLVLVSTKYGRGSEVTPISSSNESLLFSTIGSKARNWVTHVAAGRKSGGKRSSSAAIPQPADPPRRRIAPRWSAASRDEARPGAKRKDILIDLNRKKLEIS